MPSTITPKFQLELATLEQNTLLDLFEVDMRDLTSKSGNKGELYRFYAGTNEFQQPIVWQGKTYQPFGVKAEGFQMSGQGPSNRPTLTIANLNGFVTGLAHEFNQCLGAVVRRRRVYAQFLDAVNFKDGNRDADPQQERISYYLIEQLSTLTREIATFTLALPTETDNAVINSRTMLVTCGSVYRSSEYGYTGTAMFTDKDQPTTTNATAGLSKPNNINLQADGDGVALSFEYVAQNSAMVKYQIKLYKDGKFYKIYDDLTSPEIKFMGLPDGNYVAEIRAKNGAGQLSEAKTVTFNVSFTLTEFVTVPKIFGIELKWKNPLFANAGSSIELWVSKDNNFQNARKLVKLAYPTNSYTYSGLSVNDRFWFWARMTDNNGAGQFTEAVEGVPSSDATQLTDYLHGKITKSELGQSLINSLQSDIDSAVAGEARVRQSAVSNVLAQVTSETRERTKALKNEADARTREIRKESNEIRQALQAEARTRGTAIAQLQHVDQTQAQQISQATAKADDALAGVQAERTARIEANRAETVAREALTGRVANAESGLTSLQRTVTQQGQSITESSQRLNAKIDGLSVGGRNLILLSKDSLDTSNITLAPGNHHRTKSFNVSKNVDWSSARTLTLSCFIRHAANPQRISRTSGTNYYRIGAEIKVIYQDGSHKYFGCFRWGDMLKTAFEGVHHFVINIPSNKSISRVESCIIQIHQINGSPLFVSNPKLEIGNVATDWSPAPEDVEQSISAVAVDLTEYKSAQATKEQAQAQKVDDLTTRLGAAEGNISNIQSTKASKTEVASIARTALRSEWQSDAQTKADNAKSQAIAEANRLNQATSARIDTIANTLSTATQSTASEISTLQATVSGIDARADGLVKTEIDLTNLDQNTWYPVIFRGLKTGQTSRFRVSQNLIPGLHNPTWSAHGSQSFALLCEWSANGGGWGTINVARVIHNFEYGWVNDYKSPILGIGQITQESTEYCCLRGGAKYDIFAPANITVEKQPNGYVYHEQSVSAIGYNTQLVPQSMLKKLDASITESKQVTADINGKVQAIHSLRTETISGGRKAVAGIAFGSNGGEQSEIILMADKLQLVRNAQDGSPVPMFTVAQNRVAIRGDLIADGTVLSRHIRANQTFHSPFISGGSVNIGNGAFMVDSAGNLTANKGVFKGSLEGATGTFAGTVQAINVIGANLADFLNVVMYRGKKLRTDTTTYQVQVDVWIGGALVISNVGKQELHRWIFINGPLP